MISNINPTGVKTQNLTTEYKNKHNREEIKLGYGKNTTWSDCFRSFRSSRNLFNQK